MAKRQTSAPPCMSLAVRSAPSLHCACVRSSKPLRLSSRPSASPTAPSLSGPLPQRRHAADRPGWRFLRAAATPPRLHGAVPPHARPTQSDARPPSCDGPRIRVQLQPVRDPRRSRAPDRAAALPAHRQSHHDATRPLRGRYHPGRPPAQVVPRTPSRVDAFASCDLAGSPSPASAYRTSLRVHGGNRLRHSFPAELSISPLALLSLKHFSRIKSQQALASV